MRAMYLSNILKLSTCVGLMIAGVQANAAPTTNGNIIEVPNDGWYQVQRADNYQSICEGVRRCEVSLGNYIVINHTNGERFKVSVTGSTTTPANNQTGTDYVNTVSVSGNLIQWPNDGWYQVQDASSYASLCEGDSSCDVPNGKYIVINHTTGNRQTVSVPGNAPDSSGSPDQNNPSSLVTISGNTISWPDNGWYQVQNATNFESLCEGGRSCTVANGQYIVINHTTGERDNQVIISADSTLDSADMTPAEFNLVAPQVLPARCIGSIDRVNTRFCVNPDTRIFSAIREDGSLWWSYTLPGNNESNQIESVLTTEQWLIIVADKYPTLDYFTTSERANQYEASLFTKNGTFVRTVPLSFDLQENDTGSLRNVQSRYSSGVLNDPLNVIANESDAGSPQLVVGWNRWRNGSFETNNWDFSGVSVFDLSSGNLLRSLNYPDGGIAHLSLLEGDRDIVRVVTEDDIHWYYIDNISSVHPSHFAQFAADAPIKSQGEIDSQLHGGNYQDIITRVLPWVNGDPANSLLFGSVSDEPPRDFSIPYDDFTLLSQFDDDNYSNETLQCLDSGEMLKRDHMSVPINMNVFDYCEFASRTYKGKLLGNYVGRDGFGVRAENLSVFQHNSSITQAALGHSTSYSRVLDGSNRYYFGSLVGYGETAEGRNVAVTDYLSSAQFYYGSEIGTSTCTTFVDGTGITSQIDCQKYIANGRVRGFMALSADWTSYGTLRVTTDLKFGQSYAKDLVWTARDGSILAGPIPYTGPTEPLTDFYFSSGSIIIEADDKSRIELTPIAQVGESAFNVKVLGPNGTELGNFPIEILNVKCIERLDTCAVPTE